MLTLVKRSTLRLLVLSLLPSAVLIISACTKDKAAVREPAEEPRETPLADASAPKVRTAEEVAKTETTEECALDRWEDGDTAYVTCPKFTGPVRLLSIDTPESGFDDNSNRRAKYQSGLWHLDTDTIVACGQRATARAKELCREGSKVSIVGDKLDKYKRRLGFVLCDGRNINELLVAEGHAGRYPFPGPPERPALCK